MAMAEEQARPGATAPGPESGNTAEDKPEVRVEVDAQAGTRGRTAASPDAQVGGTPGAEPNPFEMASGGNLGAVTEESQPSHGGPAGANLAALLEDARALADNHWDQLLRARAEMENLRRRHAIELEKAHKYALDNFVKDLLGVRDSLELALEATSAETADLAKLREGTELTLKQLADVMIRFGVERLDPRGEPFNPEYHQAMTLQPSSEVPPNTVTSVLQKGYVLNGRLVRPALVIVSSAG
jgi:molecular chaperone GrpE